MASASKFAASAFIWLVLYLVVPAALPEKFSSVEVPTIQWIGANLVLMILFLGNWLLLGNRTLVAKLFPVAIWAAFGIIDKILGQPLVSDPSKPMLDRVDLAGSALIGVAVCALALITFVVRSRRFNSDGYNNILVFNVVVAVLATIISSNFVLHTFVGSVMLFALPYEIVVYGFGYVIPLYYVFAVAAEYAVRISSRGSSTAS